MLNFFPDPYKEEILYSTIARYHYYVGNVNFKDTLEEIFGTRNSVPSIELPSMIDYFSKQFNNSCKYSSDYIIDNHTILPYYIPFIPEHRRIDIENEMKFTNGKGLYTKLGIVAGGICVKQGLEYCPMCAKEDLDLYGEAYFHRVHQLQGIMVCPKHECLLKAYEISRKNESRLSYIRFDYKRLDNNIDFEKNEIVSEHMKRIAKAAEYLLSNNLKKYNQVVVNTKYRRLLLEKGLMTYGGSIRQQELFNSLKIYYGEKTLDRIECNVEKWEGDNWLSNIARKPETVVHPLRNIIFILFLCDNIQSFFDNEINEVSPFGKGPWPCLNKAAKHYNQNLIKKCDIYIDYKTKCPIGTFSCSCGFIYSRSGPDKFEQDKYKIGSIKNFGDLWMEKLSNILSSKQHGLREIGRLMGCDPKTVVKYATKLGVLENINTNMNIKEPNSNEQQIEKLSNDKGETYKNDILKIINDRSDFTRTQIRELMKKQFALLYRHDKNWLNNHLPESKKKTGILGVNIERVNWNQRDNEILKEIEVAYKECFNDKTLKRVTKSYLGKRIGKQAMLNVYINKLPNTKEYIEKIIESVDDFKIRRIENICNQFIQENQTLEKWQIERKAGLKSKYSTKVERKIYEFLEKFNSLK